MQSAHDTQIVGIRRVQKSIAPNGRDPWHRYAMDREQKELPMNMFERIAKWSIALGLAAVVSACVVEPREGYWDHGHNRYYHEHHWHDCTPADNFCH